MKRVIFVEPKIDGEEEIFNIFKKHNTDSRFVNPHICLVFPFESNLETDELQTIIDDILNKYNSFKIKLSGLSISYEEKNNFLFLNVIDKDKKLSQISSELYSSLGSNAKLRGQYTPHITLGKNNSIDEIKDIYESANRLLKPSYNATVSCIYCKKMVQDLDGNVSLEDEITKYMDEYNKRI